MIDKIGVSALLSPLSTAGGSGLLGGSKKDATLATITKDILGAKYNFEDKVAKTDFSGDLRSFIKENLTPEKAQGLLAALDALDKLPDSAEQGDKTTQQLLGTLRGNILDFLA